MNLRTSKDTRDTPPHESQLAYSLAQAAKMCGISVPTLRQLINNGDIITKRAGRRVLIPRQALNDFLDLN